MYVLPHSYLVLTVLLVSSHHTLLHRLAEYTVTAVDISLVKLRSGESPVKLNPSNLVARVLSQLASGLFELVTGLKVDHRSLSFLDCWSEGQMKAAYKSFAITYLLELDQS